MDEVSSLGCPNWVKKKGVLLEISPFRMRLSYLGTGVKPGLVNMDACVFLSFLKNI